MSEELLIRQAMQRITADPSKIQMGKKTYSTVASRIEAMRYIYGESLCIETEVLVHPEWRPGAAGNDSVIVVRASVLDREGTILATGHAEEIRGSNRMTETSALEVCETSAIGRALASLGLHGGEYASANEIDVAESKRARLANQRVPAGQKAVSDPFGDGNDVPPKPQDKGAGAANQKQPVPAAPAQPSAEVNPEETFVVENVTALEAFRNFSEHCNTSAELREFWSRNKKVLDGLKEEAPHQYDEVKEIFTAREKQLRKVQEGVKA
jgi:hypothetical protein